MFLAALISLVGMNVWGQENERLSFGVISDIHFDNGIGEGAMVKVPQALKNLTSYKALDAIAIAGDLADAGRADQFELLVSVFNDKANFTNPVGDLLFMMGNHDNNNGNGRANYQNGLSVFNGGEPYPLHQYKVIKGYPFITISMMSTSSTGGYPDDLLQQLDEWMAKAAAECPGKPIFVFTHVPPQWSVYGSWPEFENGSTWGSSRMNAVLNKYPQAVVFAGHSHYPLGDPRSIHQGANPKSEHNNYYTVINTASTTYSEIHPGAVVAGIHPEGYAYVTEGLIVTELENGDIELRRYDTYRNLELGADHRWVLKAPFDGSQFEYADIRDINDNPNNVKLRDGLPAPEFTKSAEIALEVTPFDATAKIPQATDDECVFRYRIRIFKGGLVTSERFIFSQFYLNTDKPGSISYYIPNLVPETSYKVEVVAYDSYDNASHPLIAEFKTPVADETNTVPEPDGQWKFEDADNLLKAEGGDMEMQPCIVGSKSIRVAETLAETEIAQTEGPSAENKAIMVPQMSALKVLRKNKELTSNWTIMWDVKMKNAVDYNSLFQTNLSNTNDGDLFIYQNKIGMHALGGYLGEIENDTWYRIVMLSMDGTVYVYVNGELIIKHAGDGRWEIDPWGFYLFADEDGEMQDTEVAEIAFWEKGLTNNQVRSLSGLNMEDDKEEPYMTVQTSAVKIVDDLEFSIKVDGNVFFTFEVPEWIEPIDVTPYVGTRSYTFRAQPMEATGQREGVIYVKGEDVETQEVAVSQIFVGDDIPEALGVWTFDDAQYPIDGGSSQSILYAAFKGSEGPEKTTSIAEANITIVDGPTEENKAINVPKDSYLWLTTNTDNEVLTDYTIMFDIKPVDLIGYKCLFQYDVTNKADGGLFIKNNQIGRGGASTMIGYVGELQPDKWYRLLMVVKESRVILYLDGKYIGESAKPQSFWTITREALLFADEDGEEGPLDVAEIRFWDMPLSESIAKRLGDVYKDVDEYFAVQTTNVRLVDETEFSISVNSNVPVTFETPDWIEPVDVEFVEGEKDYTFRTTPLESGRRSGIVSVSAEYFETQEVKVTQIAIGEELPEATGCWTFDNPENLMEGTGVATLQAAYEDENGIATSDDLEAVGIYAVEGPRDENGAIGLPVESYLLMTTNVDAPQLSSYTILWDVKPDALAGYHALLQSDPNNKRDGALYIKNGQIGIKQSGLNYNGAMEEHKWHRIVFVVKDGFANIFLDGDRVGQSTSANAIWTIQQKVLLFADDNGEDAYNEVSEVRFWDVPLTDEHVKSLGAVDQYWEEEPDYDPISVWTFDDPENLMAGTGTAVLNGAVKGEYGPEVTTDLAAAGIVPVAGPTKTNGAITVPYDSYLQMAHNLGGDQQFYSVMMDIKPKSLAGYNNNGYNVLFQTGVNNTDDGDLFLNKTQIGINISGLGYGGEVIEGKWHRIVFTVFENCMSAYIDGKIAVTTYTPNSRWTMHDVCYFFADEDGEEGDIDIAELRFWDVAITNKAVQELGGVEIDDAIDVVKDSPMMSQPGLFDLQGRMITTNKLQKGIYIQNGKKVLVK